MKYVFKMPGGKDFFLLRNVTSFQLADKTAEHPHYKVFIRVEKGRIMWKTFKTKASAQNFCVKLAKAIERVWEHG